MERANQKPTLIEARRSQASGFPFLALFARTLWRDREAVQLAITTPWSNGTIEGQINRVKVIKRQNVRTGGVRTS